jgi:large subunit ribosomal protein L29
LIRQVEGDPEGAFWRCGKEDGAMSAKEFMDKTPDQLKDQLVALKKEAFNLRFQQATGQLENTARMRAVRRDVARVKTALSLKATDAAN